VSRRWPRPPLILAAFVAFLGVTVMTGAGWGEPLNVGDLATLACAFVFALQMVVLAEALRRAPSRQLLFVEIAACGVLLSAFAPFVDHPPRLATSAPALAAVLYLALAATALVLALQNFGQARTTPTRAGILFSSEPVWAAVFSALFYGERLSAREIFGAALVLAGLVAATAFQQPRASASGASSPS
jgi:drug/metabolite transporter (DMT)-like permease